MLHATENVGGNMLWANLHLLFWLSLMPFATAWMGENHFAALPTALYGVDLLLCGIAYSILRAAIIAVNGPQSLLAIATGNDFKGKISVVLYLLAVPLAFVNRWIAIGLYAAVALIWLVPDPRIEKAITR
jgi:uncharacterized membrane protein